ncbi:unnamed protein product [Haemonchus placei]|uniref:Uncharacterized protein n=1 Tax=Haemonchus placei TaxID=6290 RepID=A0A0N4WZ83_HAEPC|nr:unnamed protein product [Haemonchus placei]
MGKAAGVEKSIRKPRRSFANYKTKMTSLPRPDAAVTASRRQCRSLILSGQIYFSFGFSTRNSTCHHVDEELYGARVMWIKPEHMRSLLPIIARGLARLLMQNAKCPRSGKLVRPCCCKEGDPYAFAIISHSVRCL